MMGRQGLSLHDQSDGWGTLGGDHVASRAPEDLRGLGDSSLGLEARLEVGGREVWPLATFTDCSLHSSR